MADKTAIPLRFAAEDEMANSTSKPVFGSAEIGDSVVDPERQVRKRGLQSQQNRSVVSGSFDGIEISYVQDFEWMDPQQSPRHIDGVAGARKSRLDWPIQIPLPRAGMDDSSTFKINDWNNFHGWVYRAQSA
jgi:hypothetical protein